MKPIRLSGHAKEQLVYRGVTEDEVVETISSCMWQPAKLGRLECRKDFVFEKEWNKKYYRIKQVRSIFIEKSENIIVITVYSYFF